jgi:hypothetical protein
MSHTSRVPGDTSGTAVPSGFIGEPLTGSPGVAVTPAASSVHKTVTTVTITPGIWRVKGVTQFIGGTISGFSFLEMSVSTANDTQGAVETRQGYSGAAGSGSYNSGELYITTATSQTIYLVTRIDYSSLGTATYTTSSILRATRIA